MNIPDFNPGTATILAINGVPTTATGTTRRPRPPRGKRTKVAMVKAAVGWNEGLHRQWFVIPVELPSLANERDWQVRNRFAQMHRKAVSKAFGPHLVNVSYFSGPFHAGAPLWIRLTRLGGRKLDRHDNLRTALKYILDGICLVTGIDDGDDRLQVEYAQEPGGAVGVRVELSNRMGA